MKGLNSKGTSIPTLFSSNGTKISPAEKATLLNEVFGKNFNAKVPPLTADDIISVEPNECPENLLCSEDDILEIILSLDTNKASGLDGISVRMLKETAATISPILCTLFNLSITMGVVPDSWNTSLITPVPKQGDLSDPNNYRPISLLPVISKVLERIIFEKLPAAEHFRPTMGVSTWEVNHRCNSVNHTQLAL